MIIFFILISVFKEEVMKLRKIVEVILAAVMLAGCGGTSKKENVITHFKQEKARTVITTDGEVDDRNSVIRALLYANEMDIAGIVLTSSMYHYAGDNAKGIKPFRWTGSDWLYKYIDDYGKVYDNLKAHDATYPTATKLKSITKIGNIKNKGEMDEVTEGSKFLEKLFLDDDKRQLYVQTWGGTNTTARALKSIEERYKGTDKWKSIQKKINDKLVLYIILDQDESYSNYIAKNWSNIKVINDKSNFWHFAYAWQLHSDQVNRTLKSDWEYKNIVNNNSPLMANYSLMGDGKMVEGELYDEQRGTMDYLKKNPNYKKYDFISEGDSPSFLYLINNGLRSLANPTYGGCGGRFGKKTDKLYVNNVLDYEPYTKQYEAQYTLSRWFDDIQNDFANRVQWTLSKEGNNAPEVSVEQGINVSAKPGEKVTLTAKATDKDHDALTYKWWRYFEADTYQDSVSKMKDQPEVMGGLQLNVIRKRDKSEKIDTIKINNADQKNMSFTVPKDAKKGDTIHMIIQVSEKKNVPNTRYQRVIITVK